MSRFKKVLLAIAAILALVLPVAVVNAPAASASNTLQCTKGAHTFSGTVQMHRSGGTITFDWATVAYVTNGTGLEYRVRWYSIGGNNLIWDSLYKTTGASSASVFPGVSRLMGAGSIVQIDAGALADGLPTCPMIFTIG